MTKNPYNPLFQPIPTTRSKNSSKPRMKKRIKNQRRNSRKLRRWNWRREAKRPNSARANN